MAGEAGLKAARNSTVQICDPGGRALGQGLLLTVGGERVVLTCHHVVAESDSSHVCVRRADGTGALEAPVAATVDEAASRPERDATVLRIDEQWDVRNPLLHAIDPDHYTSARRATGLTWLATDNFGAELQPATHRLEVKVAHPPHAYTLPVAFRLQDPSDAQPGISGGVVLCEDGVVGLVHFARRDTATQARQAYLNPLSAWVDGLPDLEHEIEPFVEAVLRKRADVLRADAVRPDGGLLEIPGYREDVFLPRAVGEEAAAALEKDGAVLVVGRRMSGKTRLACELVHSHPNSIVVIPRAFVPPSDLREDSSFHGREVVLLIENMHLNLGIKPVEWLNSLQGLCDRALVIATSGNDRDWHTVEERQTTLVDRLRVPCVFISSNEGEDLSDDEGRRLAGDLGLSTAEYERRFDGTVGSLLLEPERPPESPVLPAGARSGTTVERTSPRIHGDLPPNNLPHFGTTFVGRERETRELEELITSHRTVTLSSPDGRGKTRLAAHVASTLLPAFPGGAWWVDLGAQSESEFVAPVTAAALGIHDSASATVVDSLVARLRKRRALLVLNGIDDVTDACGALATALTDACHDLRILSTGRTPLGIPGEVVYPVAPLSFTAGAEADGPSDGVRLFLARASPHVDAAALTEPQRTQIGEIVGRLNGNPLAIELAAGHLADAGVEQLASELQGGGLVSPADDPVRAAAQRVDATLECTLDGLDPQEARFFARLGVFAGSWNLNAAVAAAAGEGVDAELVPELVRRLVDRALLVIETCQYTEDRVQMLDSVRRRAQARLDALPESARVRRRHAEYYAEFAEQAKSRLTGPHAGEWLAALEREEGNCRSALTWALGARELAVGLRLGAALWWPWYQRSRFREGREWLEKLIAQAPPDERAADEERALALALAEVLNGAGSFAYNQGDLDTAHDRYARSLALRRRLGDEALTAGSLNNLGLVARRRGDYDRAAELLDEAITVSRRWENSHWEAMHLNNLGSAHREQGATEEARRLQEESLTIFTRLGSAWGIAMAACDLGLALLDEGRPAAAAPYIARSLEVRRRIDEPQGVAQSLLAEAYRERLRDDLESAEEHTREALRISDEIGDVVRAAESLEALAMIAGGSQRPRRAARLYGAASALRATAHAVVPPVAQREHRACLDQVRARLGDEAYGRELDVGARTSLHDAIAAA